MSLMMAEPPRQTSTRTSNSSRESDRSSATRKSIHQNFPLGAIMSTGSNNPITLHSINDELFATMWSFIAETMVVSGELQRGTKEAIATLVSERNECPVCIKAHSMMGHIATKVDKRKVSEKNRDSSSRSSSSSSIAASDTEEGTESGSASTSGRTKTKRDNVHYEAVLYAELLIYEVNAQRSMCVDLTNGCCHNGNTNALRTNPLMVDTNCWDSLTESAKAEVALVVALFLHVNRVVSAIMGEEMTTAMMSIPRPAAKVMESVGAIKIMSRIMSPLLAGTFRMLPESGFTESLFPKDINTNNNHTPTSTASATSSNNDNSERENDEKVKLPKGLQNLTLAGPERAKAVSRLISWVAQYESDLLLDGEILDYDIIKFINSGTMRSKDDMGSSQEALEWIDEAVRIELPHHYDGPVEEWKMALATVLILITLAPKGIYKSQPWKALVEQWGEHQARSIVVFWSLRTTLQEAHILFSGVSSSNNGNDSSDCSDDDHQASEQQQKPPGGEVGPFNVVFPSHPE